MINCLIVDDEPVAQSILETYVNRTAQLCLVKKCSTAFEAFEILHEHKIDLMFLDIKMPGLNGIDFLKSLKHPPAVIFTTAFSEYAVASYELEAIDYLLKPITIDRFQKSLAKLFKHHAVSDIKEKDYTYFKISRKLLRIDHGNIFYAQSIKDYIILHTQDGKMIIHMTMKYLSELLPASTFSRVHRSWLVNHFYISEIGKSRIKVNGFDIPFSESYNDAINKLKSCN